MKGLTLDEICVLEAASRAFEAAFGGTGKFDFSIKHDCPPSGNPYEGYEENFVYQGWQARGQHDAEVMKQKDAEIAACNEENEVLQTEKNQLEDDYESHQKKIEQKDALLAQALEALEFLDDKVYQEYFCGDGYPREMKDGMQKSGDTITAITVHLSEKE